MCRLPRIAVTMGDPAGVGPEIIVRAFSDQDIQTICQPLVIGHPQIIQRAVDWLDLGLAIVELRSPDQLGDIGSDDSGGIIPCLAVGSDDVLEVPAGLMDARAGHSAYEAVGTAIDLALAQHIDAIVTAPLCKESLHMAGHIYPGHTELLAERCGIDKFAMMLYLPSGDLVRGPAGLGVVHVTLHMAIHDVVAHLSIQAITSKCILADAALRDLGAANPRIGVCALNPHAGESGLFGAEEQTVIGPAIVQARAIGLDVAGPFSADTLFPAARDGAFDAVVAMYHDQGHIALKLLDMHSAVNITLGLPIIRTSVAHGTAFDRAWRGHAVASGMVAAIQTAAQLARNRGTTMACRSQP